VSQAISAGGIPVDSTWAPETTAWINTGRNMTGLKQYMVDTKGYFYKTTQTAVSAGGWIFDTAPNSSHVMFVVANDGITMLFSAHTNDRKQASFANFGTQYEYYYISSSYAIN
jgi:RNA polymerase sigma-70 factor (ECF subfamily)